ncbi:hypothetical protein BDZ89DRAFT_1117887 [Hymenopellis radicata]|nr:hypothetical protein BDZ89DRAFT_1117887 [Hymenopellis radicata]
MVIHLAPMPPIERLRIGSGIQETCKQLYYTVSEVPPPLRSLLHLEIQSDDTVPLETSYEFYRLLQELQLGYSVECMALIGLSWRRSLNPQALSATITFPGLRQLHLAGIQCTQQQLADLLSSLPYLSELEIGGNMAIDIRPPIYADGRRNSWTAHTFENVGHPNLAAIKAGQRGPVLRKLSMSFDQANRKQKILQLFTSRDSPVITSTLQDITIEGDSIDNSMLDYLSLLLELAGRSLRLLTIGDLCTEQRLNPLQIYSVPILRITIGLFLPSGIAHCLGWWARTFQVLDNNNALRHLEILLDVKYDGNRMERPLSTDLLDSWHALDEALCRKEFVLQGLKIHLRCCPKTKDEGPSLCHTLRNTWLPGTIAKHRMNVDIINNAFEFDESSYLHSDASSLVGTFNQLRLQDSPF